ncbi:VOC family protein [Rhodococcoides kyotonense]|uniref:Lactoylglutathione lyase n=1 Tax=Rhodococcoides kyotonense TaxID=398843 RepID=A0A239N0N9_9NOCA|nr:VOC family protein [Rhodococcus kyotonensis]SNT48531.1 lactoylglutathione lyase [Rhodococcus kyotonensis]
MLVRLDHIDLRVADLGATLEFFTSLGFEVLRRMEERGSAEVALPGEHQVMFEIRQDDKIEGSKIDHIAFSVDDPDAAIAKIKAAGGTFSREHHPTPTGRTVSNFVDINGAKWQLAE